MIRPWLPGPCTQALRFGPLYRKRSPAPWIGWWECRAKNGGFAAFDADNTCYYLNTIPFADHGALDAGPERR